VFERTYGSLREAATEALTRLGQGEAIHKRLELEGRAERLVVDDLCRSHKVRNWHAEQVRFSNWRKAARDAADILAAHGHVYVYTEYDEHHRLMVHVRPSGARPSDG
jgi:hypothetical protein